MKLTSDQVKKVGKRDDFRLKLRGKAAVFIDWANVYGWRQSLKREVEPRKLFKYLKNYPEVEEINFYYGIDRHPKSKQLLNDIRKVGFNVVSKDVKYIPVSLDLSHFKEMAREVKDALKLINNLDIKIVEKILHILDRKVLRRKCDFDMEIALDCFGCLNQYSSFVFFSGDGDFEPLYKFLIRLKKQVIVIYASGHLGKEVWNLRRGIFKTEIDNLPVLEKIPPSTKAGRD